VPTFIRQIKSGGPVTVSDPTMLRYFMTIGEAVQLVLQASALADGGEVFVLDMGEPVLIGDLARRTIRLAGLVPGRDIDIVITGARPGEKHAEILSRTPLEQSSHAKIRIAQPNYPRPATLHDAVAELSRLAHAGERGAAGELLHTIAWQSWDADEVLNLNELATIGVPDTVA
jgi:FlaA1/EpsC-like NDP-sugar epimerase